MYAILKLKVRGNRVRVSVKQNLCAHSINSEKCGKNSVHSGRLPILHLP